jgi:hypothetical protein
MGKAGQDTAEHENALADIAMVPRLLLRYNMMHIFYAWSACTVRCANSEIAKDGLMAMIVGCYPPGMMNQLFPFVHITYAETIQSTYKHKISRPDTEYNIVAVYIDLFLLGLFCVIEA